MVCLLVSLVPSTLCWSRVSEEFKQCLNEPTVRSAPGGVLVMDADSHALGLDKIEETMERLERRLWLTVYGVVATILAQGFQSLLNMTP